MTPDISVLMGVYNGARYLKTSLDSIFSQTFNNFECIVVDDCSKDETKSILNSFSDSRLKIIRNKKNIGLTRCLNKALKIARGRYFIRQDADDISLSYRFEKQYKCICDNPNAAVVSSWIDVIDENEKHLFFVKPPPDSLFLKWKILTKATIAHSSVLVNTTYIKELGGYNESIECAQDFELWGRVLFKYDITSVPEILVKWRYHDRNITHQKAELQKKNTLFTIKRNLEYLLQHPVSKENILWLHRYLYLYKPLEYEQALVIIALYTDFYKKFNKKWVHDKKIPLIKRDFAVFLLNAAILIDKRSKKFELLAKILIKDYKTFFTFSSLICLIKCLIGNRPVKMVKQIINKSSKNS